MITIDNTSTEIHVLKSNFSDYDSNTTFEVFNDSTKEKIVDVFLVDFVLIDNDMMLTLDISNMFDGQPEGFYTLHLGGNIYLEKINYRNPNLANDSNTIIYSNFGE